MSGAEIFILIVLLIPIYGLLIWGYIEPEESILFGKRWMYQEDPKLSEEAIQFHKKVSMGAIIVITVIALFMIFGGR